MCVIRSYSADGTFNSRDLSVCEPCCSKMGVRSPKSRWLRSPLVTHTTLSSRKERSIVASGDSTSWGVAQSNRTLTWHASGHRSTASCRTSGGSTASGDMRHRTCRQTESENGWTTREKHTMKRRKRREACCKTVCFGVPGKIISVLKSLALCS